VSEDVKQRAQFLLTENFEELLLAWMHAFLKHSTFHHQFQKKKIEIACQPSTGIRVEEVNGRGAPTSQKGGKVGRPTYWH
jgi:hypothetical protein